MRQKVEIINGKTYVLKIVDSLKDIKLFENSDPDVNQFIPLSPIPFLIGDGLLFINNTLVNDGTAPTVIKGNGDRIYFTNFQLHREDGPAIEYANGDKEWYKNRKLHREDGPAIEFVNGDKKWYINDKLQKKPPCQNHINLKICKS